MRVYGRVPNGSGGLTWVVVQTAPNGDNSEVYLTALCQCLKLDVGESPFWADWGIPSRRSVVQQLYPDLWVNLMQQRFAQYFAALKVVKVQAAQPTYNIFAVTLLGAPVNIQVAT